MSGQRLVDFVVIPKGDKQYPDGALKIKVIPGCKREIREIRENGQGLDAQFFDVIEYQLCNGWTAVPEHLYGQLPALTSAIILASDDFVVDDGYDNILEVGMIYSYGGYQIRGEIDVLLERGEIVFDAYDYSLPPLKVGDKVKIPSDPFLPDLVWEVRKHDPEGAEEWIRPYYVEKGPFNGWHARRELVLVETEEEVAS
jgi:hypothetical protein